MRLSRRSPLVPQVLALLPPGLVSTRQLESWSQAGLLPCNHVPVQELAAHVAQLAEVYRPGPDATRKAALVLAARGYPCSVLSEVLRDYYHAKMVKTPSPDTTEGQRAIRQEAQAVLNRAEAPVVGAPVVLNEFYAQMVKAALDQARSQPATDSLTRTAERPEVAVKDALTVVLEAMYGDPEPPTEEGLARVETYGAPPIPPTIGDLADRTEAAKVLTEETTNFGAYLAYAVDNAGPEDFARGAMVMRALLVLVPATKVSVLADPEKLDYLAGLMAPIGVAMAYIGPRLASLVPANALGQQPISLTFDPTSPAGRRLLESTGLLGALHNPLPPPARQADDL
jgi:hypothetical protein